MLPGAADAQIGFAVYPRASPFHARFGARNALDIELQVAQEGRSGSGGAHRVLRCEDYRCQVESLRHQQPLDHHAPGKQPRLRRAREPQGAAREPAHAFGVADADSPGARGEVVAQRALAVGDRTAEQ